MSGSEAYNNIKPFLNGKRAAVFDMDGTLLDSMSMWGRLDEEYMKSLGITPKPEFYKAVTSMTLPMASEYIVKEYPVPYTADEVYAQFLKMADDYYRYKLPIKGWVYGLMRSMYEDGFSMMVATANEYDMSCAALIRNDIYKFTKGIVTCTMAGASKESPAVFLMACDKLGVRVDECVIFEDSLYAVKTAADAGFTVIGVYDDAEKQNWDEICKLTVCQVV